MIKLSLTGAPDRLLQPLPDTALDGRCTVVAALDTDAVGGGFPVLHPGVAAPGRDVLAPLPGARGQPVSGASYAAAYARGLFALLHQLGGAGAGRAATTALVRAGGIDACATLAAGSGTGGCACNCYLQQGASAGRAAVR